MPYRDQTFFEEIVDEIRASSGWFIVAWVISAAIHTGVLLAMMGYNLNLTPQDIINRLNAEVLRILRMPDVAESLERLGVQIVGSSPAELGAYIRTEIAKYQRLLRAAGIQPE